MPQHRYPEQPLSDHRPPTGGPRRHFIWAMVKVGGILFAIELAVMCLLPAFGLVGMWENAADSLLLALLAMGPLYFLGFRSYSLKDNEASPPGNFRLFRYFVLLSVAASIAILLLVGLGLRGVLRNYVVKEAKQDSRNLSAAIRDLEESALIHRGTGGSRRLAVGPDEMSKLDWRMRAFLTPFDVVKIKVFDRERRIIYSTDRKIIGKRVGDNASLTSSLSGVTVSKLDSKDSVWDLAEEERFRIDLVETYVPVFDIDGHVLGSFEIYKDVTRYLNVADATLIRSVGILALALLVVFFALAAVMHRAARLIRSHTVSLERSREELRASRRRAEEADQAKSRFLAQMSHEIRTPMTAILGFIDVIEERYQDAPSSDKGDFADHFRTIKRNGEHLLQLINDILDLSKIEADKLVVECIACSPCAIVSSVASLMRTRALEKELSFKIEFAGPIPETIQSDPTRLRQILLNLVGNAIKFTRHGQVRLVARLLPADSPERPSAIPNPQSAISNPQSPTMQFEVIDTGIGIAPEHLPELFQPFTQADNSMSRRFGGTGLGLAISRRLAETLGGGISVESERGVGSTFRVTVSTGPLDGVAMIERPAEAIIDPARTGDSAGATAAKAKAGKTAAAKLDCRILLAEDGPDNQQLITFILRKAGAEVTLAENGMLAAEAALAARAVHKPYHVILMDMQMPVMDGYEATGLLREKGYAGPIIALTAHAMTGDREKCLKAGCDDYTSKPIDRKILFEKIRAALEGERGSDAQRGAPLSCPTAGSSAGTGR